MKVALISRTDSSGGGASRCAAHLAQLLDDYGDVEVHHWVRHVSRGRFDRTRFLHDGRMGKLLYRACQFASRKIGLPDFLTPEFLFFGAGQDYDLVHIHDIPATMSPMLVRKIAEDTPVIRTLHDCSSFTGGCISPMGCVKYEAGCHHCPQLGRWPMLTGIDRTGFIQDYKRKTVMAGNVTAAAPSRWMANMALSSGVYMNRPEVIHNAVDTGVFDIKEKCEVRKRLNLPQDKFLVLISSLSLDNPFKGTDHALQALENFNREAVLLMIGKKPEDNRFQDRLPGMEIITTGFIDNDERLSDYYGAADVFLYPTLSDNLPYVLLEAMATGTPAITYATGGVPEIVSHDRNGWMTDCGDIDGILEGLSVAYGSRERLYSWREQAINTVRMKFDQQEFLARYMELYRQVT